ncbi:hypothetical protein [Pseudonocardia nigra]|uniref:hypothetical protein n=1 Tax=Pseudonocardia nigra TaxID=1921578 RepID=UPI001C5E3017|nr:hypothetical protein [Pseudonocardia nigra]
MSEDRPDDAVHESPGDRAEQAFTAAARLLATQPGSIQRALATHHHAPDGRCAACGTISRWPCAIATIAQRAARLTNP